MVLSQACAGHRARGVRGGIRHQKSVAGPGAVGDNHDHVCGCLGAGPGGRISSRKRAGDRVVRMGSPGRGSCSAVPGRRHHRVTRIRRRRRRFARRAAHRSRPPGSRPVDTDARQDISSLRGRRR
ncbi:hypothetical protein RHCRD62_60341 [Rhodococcus sp. RD6.2]|nr:hypothetical protein RHCRD62_60341 [Rhodococcus sp. RD6.2]